MQLWNGPEGNHGFPHVLPVAAAGLSRRGVVELLTRSSEGCVCHFLWLLLLDQGADAVGEVSPGISVGTSTLPTVAGRSGH